MPARAVAVAMAGLLLHAAPALADYPERPITLIVGFGAGGATDVNVRTIVPALERCLGSDAEVIVLNRPGASGDIAYAELASATPDGYTIGNLNLPGVITNTLVKEAPYSSDSFTVLGSVTGSTVFVSVAKDSPWNSMQELIDAAHESDAPLLVATGSLGSSDHLAMLAIARETGAKFTFLPLDSSAASISSLIGGHVQVAAASSGEQFKDQVKILGVAADERLPTLPDVPTLKEQGFNIGGGAVHILAGPKGMPEEAIAKLSGCIEGLPEDQAFIAEAKQRSMPIMPLSAEEASALIEQQGNVLRSLWEENPWIK